MKPLMMKFGGTSVQTAEQRRRAAERAVQAKQEGFAPVVVVSAMGRKGEPYATDTLVSLLDESSPAVQPREKDLLMACGEIISTVVMAHLIGTVGPYPSVALTGGQAGIMTDRAFGQARILAIDPARVQRALDEDLIPVVAGFQGVTRSPDEHEHGAITTLGRGGSDTTASALGAALHAAEVRIFSDVPGIMTADPKIVPHARTLRCVTYEEICEMAHQGARVLHPRCAQIAMDYHIPLRVLATMGTDDVGTLIVREPTRSRDREHGATAVANSQVVVPLSLTVGEAADKPEAEREILMRLADADISVYFVSSTAQTLSFVINKDVLDGARQALHDIHIPVQTPGAARAADRRATSLQVGSDAVIVSVIGRGLQRVPGIMARAAEALETAGIEIRQVAGSANALSCLVPAERRDEAVRSLHDKFHLHLLDEEQAASS
ncbi:MAG: aspartate kinase [Armatimonadota bacterium]